MSGWPRRQWKQVPMQAALAMRIRGRENHQRMRLCRWSATTALLIGVAVGAAPVGHAQPENDVDDLAGAASSDEPLPAPSGDLVGVKPPADTLPPPPATPYPDVGLIVRSYERRQPGEFFTASNEGVWFSTPLGLNCGIWDRGSFGCTGDIRGAPPGTTHIGWVNGNIVTRYDSYDPLLPMQFPPGRAERMLPPRSFVEYNGTRCTTMADSSTFCARGSFQFLVTPTTTILSPP